MHSRSHPARLARLFARATVDLASHATSDLMYGVEGSSKLLLGRRRQVLRIDAYVNIER